MVPIFLTGILSGKPWLKLYLNLISDFEFESPPPILGEVNLSFGDVAVDILKWFYANTIVYKSLRTCSLDIKYSISFLLSVTENLPKSISWGNVASFGPLELYGYLLFETSFLHSLRHSEKIFSYSYFFIAPKDFSLFSYLNAFFSLSSSYFNWLIISMSFS